MRTFTIQFDDNQMDRLQTLKHSLGVSSEAEVIRRAISFLSRIETISQVRPDTIMKMNEILSADLL